MVLRLICLVNQSVKDDLLDEPSIEAHGRAMNDATPTPAAAHRTDTPRTVAVLGLGAMGSGMARNLAAAGHPVTVWNRSVERAVALAAEHDVRVAATPAAAAADVDVVIAMVRDDEASHAVWLGSDGAAAALPTEVVAIEASTITPAWATELGHAMAERDRAFLEAPVVGSRPQLAAGALVSLVGGDADVVDRIRPILEVNSGTIRHCGDVGAGAVAKLAVNGLFAAQVAAFAETVGFLTRNGVALDEATSFLTALPVTAPALQRILGLFAAGDYAPNFPIELVAKDLGYLSAAAQHSGADATVLGHVEAVFTAAVASGVGELDIAGLGSRHF